MAKKKEPKTMKGKERKVMTGDGRKSIEKACFRDMHEQFFGKKKRMAR